MELISVKQAAAFLNECDGCLIYTHASPDGDTIGSSVALALGLRKLGKDASVFSVDGIPEKLSFIPNEGLFVASEPENGVTRISVDVAGPMMLGRAQNKLFSLSIDHHKVNTIDCERLLIMSDRIACGEIIYLVLQELDVELDYDIATALYAAISSDSGGFRYEATKPETHVIAAKCLETGIDFAEINRRLFESKTLSQVALIKTAYKNLEVIECGASETDFDCINSIPREIAGVLASAVIRKKPDGIKVSLRSNADIDVAELARTQNGGGHYHAAGFKLDGSFDEALTLVRRLFTEIEI